MNAAAWIDLTGRERTPVIRQSEASECGLACLAMVAGFHGLRTDLTAMRRRFSVSLKGATLRTLISMAERIGLQSRAVRAEPGALRQLQLPAVLHWDLNHFVVLVAVRGTRFRIHDPARGAEWIDADRLSRHFTGVALELAKAEGFRKGSERTPLRIGQLWSRMVGLGGTLRNILLLSAILQLVSLASPFYLQLAVDTVFPAFDRDLLLVLALGFGGLAVVNLLTGWLRSLILVSLGNSLSYQLVVNLYRHLLRLPLPWFEKRHVGDVISRFGSTQPISDLLAQGLIAAVIDGTMALVTLALMFLYSPALAAIALVACLAFGALNIVSFRAVRSRNLDSIAASARENSSFIESVRGIAAVKAFGQELTRQRQWQQLKAEAVNAQIKLGRINAGYAAIGQFILAIERVVFVYLAVRFAMAGTFTVGMIFAFQAYKQQFLDAATRLVDFAIRYRLLDVHLGRLTDIVLTPPELVEEPLAGEDPPPTGAIELRQLGFRYGEGEPEVLKSVTMSIQPGETVALIGPSGGGKTTLLKLMMGLVPPSWGQLLVDGKPLGPARLGHWRRHIGFVAQDDQLFAGSLAENIAFFDPDIDMQRVVEAAHLAAIHDDIEAMPMRYETLVGDMGSSLSGGQKQRIFIARALYNRPAVLFIDEGTAHLDPDSEQQVIETISRLRCTRIVSAHRPAASASADRIFLVAGGNVIAVGGDRGRLAGRPDPIVTGS